MVEGWEMNGREGKEGGVCGEEGNGKCIEAAWVVVMVVCGNGLQ